MDKIIEQLKEARQQAGLSLQDIHKRTKIPLHQLEHLESLQLDQIGPSVYIKGFIRRYAQEVGIEPDTLWEQEMGTVDVVPTRSKPRRKTKSIDFTPVVRVLAVIAILALVVFLINVAIENFRTPGPPEPPSTPPGHDQDNEQLDPELEPDPEPEPEPEPEVTVELIEEDDSHAIYLVKNTDQLDVVLEFSGTCWTRITADGEMLNESTFYQGDSEELSGAQVFQFRFGAPIEANVTVNSVEMDIPELRRAFNLEIRLEEQQQNQQEETD